MTGPLQCPCCALRFARKTELDWHLREDHSRPASTLEVEKIATYRRPAGRTLGGAGR